VGYGGALCSIVVAIKQFFVSAWNHEAIRFFRTVAIDLWRSACILLSLEIIWWLLKQMEFSGFPAERLAYFERVHFCSSLSAFTLVSVTFLLKLAAGLYGRPHKEHK